MHRLSTVSIAMALSLAVIALFANVAAASAPEVTTEEAIRLSGETATPTGTINPGGHETAYAFLYGNSGTTYEDIDTEYDGMTEVGLLPAGSSPVSVEALITGLEPETTYHYRLIAMNADGPTAGEDSTFTTTEIFAPRLDFDGTPTWLFASYVERGVFSDPEGIKIFHLNGFGDVECETALSWQSKPAPASEFALKALYGGCTVGGLNGSVKMNTCTYGYALGTTGPPVYSGSVGVQCSTEGDAITIAFTGIEGCVIKIPAQSAPSSVSYTNEGSGEDAVIHTDASAEELTISVENPKEKALCTIVQEYAESAEFSHDLTLYGEDAEGYVGASVIGDEVP